jgi:hypothetical protein
VKAEVREKGDVVTSTITGAEDTVSEVCFAGKIGIVKLQTPYVSEYSMLHEVRVLGELFSQFIT